jgi:hypothetical protein
MNKLFRTFHVFKNPSQGAVAWLEKRVPADMGILYQVVAAVTKSAVTVLEDGGYYITNVITGHISYTSANGNKEIFANEKSEDQ